jgi:hypothetical protein
MSPRKIMLAAFGFGLALPCAQAMAEPVPIAVFPFMIHDTSGVESPGQAERLQVATYAKEIDALQPPDECGECWAAVARKAGATLEVLPSVQKVSVLISQMTMWVADVKTMKYTRLVQGQIRGDTAEAYTRGIDFLVHAELLKKQ